MTRTKNRSTASTARSRRRHVPRRPGAPPGTLFTGPVQTKPIVRLVRYGVDALDEREIDGPDDVPEEDPRFGTVWVDVAGPADESFLEAMAQRFGFHPLAIEDVAHLDQRPKSDSYPPYTFIVARAAMPGESVETEQVSMFLRPGLLVSFQERTEDAFVAVRERIRGGRLRLRTGGSEYLTYTLLDSAVDSFFPAVERLRDRLERLEDVVLDDASDTVLRAIQTVRSDLLTIHRALWPQREMLAKILREEEPFGDEVLLFLRDVHDHALQIVDLVETYREIGSSLMSVFLTQVSNRMNEVMKVLTMIATVFIPLSFIVGLYGMNFDGQASRWNMPELGWKYGYPAVLALMALVVAGFVTFFVRRGWLR